MHLLSRASTYCLNAETVSEVHARTVRSESVRNLSRTEKLSARGSSLAVEVEAEASGILSVISAVIAQFSLIL